MGNGKLYQVKIKVSRDDYRPKTVKGYVFGESLKVKQAEETALKKVEQKVCREVGLGFEIKVTEVKRINFDFILNGENKEQP